MSRNRTSHCWGTEVQEFTHIPKHCINKGLLESHHLKNVPELNDIRSEFFITECNTQHLLSFPLGIFVTVQLFTAEFVSRSWTWRPFGRAGTLQSAPGELPGWILGKIYSQEEQQCVGTAPREEEESPSPEVLRVEMWHWGCGQCVQQGGLEVDLVISKDFF